MEHKLLIPIIIIIAFSAGFMTNEVVFHAPEPIAIAEPEPIPEPIIEPEPEVTLVKIKNFKTTITEDTKKGTRLGKLKIIQDKNSNISKMILRGKSAKHFTLTNDGTLRVAKKAKLDFERRRRYYLEAIAINEAGKSKPAKLTITLTNIAETVPSLKNFTETLSEKSVNETQIGRIEIKHTGDTVLNGFKISGNDASSFRITNKGELFIAKSAKLNFAQKKSYTFKATASNNAGDSKAVDVNIDLFDDITTQSKKIIAHDKKENGYFGHTVKMTKSMIVVGAYGDKEGLHSGAVYLYNRKDHSLITKLQANDERDNAFGYSLFANDEMVVVGAYLDNEKGHNAGAVYIYLKNKAGNFSFTQKIFSNEIEVGDSFGHTITYHNYRLLISAPEENKKRGALYIFALTEDNLFQQQKRIAPNSLKEGDHFGHALAMNDNLLAVSAHQSSIEHNASGSVYTYAAKGFAPLPRVHAPKEIKAAYFGQSLALHNHSLFIGANGDDSSQKSSGAVYQFHIGETDKLIYKTKLITHDIQSGDHLGFSLATSGKYLLISAHGDDDKGIASGSAYLYKANTKEQYKELAKLNAEDGSVVDFFGYDLDIHNQEVIVGAYQDDDGAPASGSLYHFRFKE
jgi:hypothetical protein